MDELVQKQIPPHDAMAEQAVISSMCTNNEALATIRDFLTAEDFYDINNAYVFKAILELYNDASSDDINRDARIVDLVKLNYKLESMQVPETTKSTDFLSKFLDINTYSTNYEDYANIVYEKSILRRLIKASEKIKSFCFTKNIVIEETIEKAENEVREAVKNTKSANYTKINEIVTQVINKIIEDMKNAGEITGISSGFKDLDSQTSGFQKSDLILIAARPAMGKTAFALNIAQHVATEGDVCTAIFSLEMPKEQLVRRMLASKSNVKMQDIRNGMVDEDDLEALVDASAKISDSKLIIDDSSGITVSELRRKCKIYKEKDGLGLVIIDYLQLMSGSGKENRQQEISDISRGLKQLARELDIPVIALSQLSRAVEQRTGDHRPKLSDLRESGAIEQDADIVMFIYREDYYFPDTTKKRNVAEIIISKHRNGPVGTVELTWVPDYTKFATIERGSYDLN